MYSTILVPTDGSETATRAVDHAVGLATQYDATIHALSVVDISELGLRTPTDIDLEKLRRPLRDRAQTAVGAVTRVCDNAGVDVVEAITVGVTHEEIVDYAVDNGVGIIVMGTHGRSSLPHALLGSVTDRVVRSASVPVLAVPPDSSP